MPARTYCCDAQMISNMMKSIRSTYFPVIHTGLIFGLSMVVLSAQSTLDSVQSLPVLEVKASFDREQSIGASQRSWSVEQLGQLSVNNLAEALSLETSTYLKSYGLGSLATSSIRGGSAGQTLILWNGLPLRSPMLGQLDLALLPTQAVEEMTLTKGGGSSLWGSGAIGGVLNLNNRAAFGKTFSLNSGTDLGSFGQFQQQLGLDLGGQKWRARTKLSHRQAQNNFYYPLGRGLPERQQTNAALSQQSFLQDFYWRLDERKTLAAHFWWQASDRQIPPTNVQTRSEAYQQDQSTRFMLDFTEVTRRGKWEMKAGFFEEHLGFYDPQIRLASESRFRTYLGDISASWQLGEQQHLLLGSTQTLTEARAEGYGAQIPQQWRIALFASWKGRWRAGVFQFSLRQEMVDGRLVPLMPALGLQWELPAQLSLKVKVSRNYRLPTFNDLYWRPGGNPNLLAESGWSQELGFEKVWQAGKLGINTSITAFNRLIDNWILWSIQEEQSFWSANNITRVWSRGLEPRLNINYAFSDGQIDWQNGYDYIRSTNQIALERPRMKAGTQLLYTPVHQLFTKISLKYRNTQLTYHHRYTGATQGQNEAIPAFQVGRLGLGWQVLMKRYQIQVHGSINNLWDSNYVIIERRPMPGRHFQISLQFSYSQK